MHEAVAECTKIQMINIRSKMFFTSSENKSIFVDHDDAVRKQTVKFSATKKSKIEDSSYNIRCQKTKHTKTDQILTYT